MTMLRQLTWGLLATGALTLMACSEQAVAPNDGPVSGDMLAAKGGGGKPGGGGGGGGGGGTVASAEIAFHYNGTLWVMNADGCRTDRPARQRLFHVELVVGAGRQRHDRSAVPYPQWGICDPKRSPSPMWIRLADRFTSATSSTFTSPVTGGTQAIRVARHYGQPAWKPGAGDEIVLSASWQSNPVTNEWVSALYIFATTELPNPTPQLLYQAPSGCTDAVRPAWSPDGGSIAFVESCGAAGAGIEVLDRGDRRSHDRAGILAYLTASVRSIGRHPVSAWRSVPEGRSTHCGSLPVQSRSGSRPDSAPPGRRVQQTAGSRSIRPSAARSVSSISSPATRRRLEAASNRPGGADDAVRG